MTVKEYKEQFRKLYEQLCEEHGHVHHITLSDVTKYHWNQLGPGVDMWIDCYIDFD